MTTKTATEIPTESEIVPEIASDIATIKRAHSLLTPATDLTAHLVPRTPALISKEWDGQVTINLSRDHAAVLLDSSGNSLDHVELGRRGLTMRQAWDSAALQLLRAQRDPYTVHFDVRNSSFSLGPKSPRGFEVKGDPAASWLAHPKAFQMLHRHFMHVLKPEHAITYLTRDHRELFVLDCTPEQAATTLPYATVFTYSLGFPIKRTIV